MLPYGDGSFPMSDSPSPIEPLADSSIFSTLTLGRLPPAPRRALFMKPTQRYSERIPLTLPYMGTDG